MPQSPDDALLASLNPHGDNPPPWLKTVTEAIASSLAKIAVTVDDAAGRLKDAVAKVLASRVEGAKAKADADAGSPTSKTGQPEPDKSPWERIAEVIRQSLETKLGSLADNLLSKVGIKGGGSLFKELTGDSAGSSIKDLFSQLFSGMTGPAGGSIPTVFPAAGGASGAASGAAGAGTAGAGGGAAGAAAGGGAAAAGGGAALAAAGPVGAAVAVGLVAAQAIQKQIETIQKVVKALVDALKKAAAVAFTVASGGAGAVVVDLMTRAVTKFSEGITGTARALESFVGVFAKYVQAYNPAVMVRVNQALENMRAKGFRVEGRY